MHVPTMLVSLVSLVGCAPPNDYDVRDAGPLLMPADATTSTVIFDATSARSLDPFTLAIEAPADIVGRPYLGLVPEGVTGLPGTGNFTAYHFADLPTSRFRLVANVSIPAGARYSNSGFYLIYTDPAIDTAALPPAQATAIVAARAEAAARRAQLGPGPFELDYFAHEVQIVAGTPQPDLPADQRAGAIYNVPIGSSGVGTQVRATDYALVPGDTYELTVVADTGSIEVWLRSIRYQAAPVLVTEFHNLDRDADPVRGGSPIALALQIYYNDGVDVQHPVFEHLELATW